MGFVIDSFAFRHRSAHAASWVVAVVAAALASAASSGCSGGEGVTTASASNAPGPAVSPSSVARPDVERDLRLVLRRPVSEPFELGHPAGIQLALVNHSSTRSYPVVLSGDGSEAGWREPHVFYVVERRTGAGPWEEAPKVEVSRCGNYDEDWTKDVVALGPGQEVALPWVDFYNEWDLESASHVRIAARYVYGDHARDLRKVPQSLHSMPAYALASNAIELAIDPPITLDLTWKGPLPKPGEALAPAVQLSALNRGTSPLPFASADTGASLTLEVEGLGADGKTASERISTSYSVDDAKGRIAPGERRSVVGAAKSVDSNFMEPGFRPRRVRALLHLWWYVDASLHASSERIARSPWVDIAR